MESFRLFFEKSTATTKYGCCMAMLTSKEARPLQKFIDAIPAADLAEEGREDEPHITVLYGLLADAADELLVVLNGLGEIRARLGDISAFCNAEHDVLKVAVDSADLKKANKLLRTLPFESKYPRYQPHLTLAYLKPGKAAEYIKKYRKKFSGIKCTFSELVYSNKDKDWTVFSIL
jgi:2'-5' RNA ligase